MDKEGLSIVDKRTDLTYEVPFHQGTIRAEKNEPAGAKFIVELRPAILLDSDPDPSSAASPFAATQNGNYSEVKPVETRSVETPAVSAPQLQDDLASTIARGSE